ncbi:MAG TPA: hypothetical protein VFX59_26350 [Polyangiales bacterium]|nr:hypothetical protein [Polyangiales bacterium]
MRFALVIAMLSCALPVHAERGLLEQRIGELRAGERLRVELETPHGLTPPPGIQNERALRGFAARLCAEARCVPLAALNVRPRDGWSMVYSAEFAIPAELPPGHYALDVRFPGGLSTLPGGVTVQAGPAAPPTRPRPSGCSVAGGAGQGAPLGLLLLAVSRKLGPARRARSRCGNSLRRSPVS